jgi:uncharacterized protein YbaR (Trm112 family)
MKEEETITYIVVCPFNRSHKLPVVLEVEEIKMKKKKKECVEVYCPSCDKYFQVAIDKQLKPDTTVTRGISSGN